MSTMKGPYERLKYDLRRVFECPRCHRRVRTPGSITTFWCECTPPETDKPVCMSMREDGIRRVDGRSVRRPRDLP